MVLSSVQEKADTLPINHRGNVPFCAFSGDLQTVMITWAGPGALTSSLADGIHFPLGGLVVAPPHGLLSLGCQLQQHLYLQGQTGQAFHPRNWERMTSDRANDTSGQSDQREDHWYLTGTCLKKLRILLTYTKAHCVPPHEGSSTSAYQNWDFHNCHPREDRPFLKTAGLCPAHSFWLVILLVWSSTMGSLSLQYPLVVRGQTTTEHWSPGTLGCWHGHFMVAMQTSQIWKWDQSTQVS